MGQYAGALASVVLALGVRLLLNPILGARFPLLTIMLAVVVSARYFGAGPGVAAVVAGAIAANILYDYRSLGPSGAAFGLAPFFVLSLLVIWMMEALRRARQRADDRLAQLKAESARREAEQRFAAQLRAIVESSDDAIISSRLNGHIASWNRAAEEIFGYTAAQAIGKPISMLTPPERAGEEAGMIALIRSGGRVKPFDTIRQRRDGSPIQLSLTISPIHHEDGSLAGTSYIASDITERKQFEQRLTQTQKLESLVVLAGGLAHDFNNLLTGIMGNASLALKMETQAAAQARIAEVLKASECAALLVRQMLAYAGKGAFVVERVDLSQLVRDIVPLVRASIPRTVELDLQLAEGLPGVDGDRAQMQQMVMNLIVNAAESIGDRPGSVCVATCIGGTAGQRRVVFEVRDNGCGMDDATKVRIFDPFFTTKFTGRGLGLAAVLGIIRAHQGEIAVESAPEQGSVFRVILPVCEEPATRTAAYPA